MNVSRVDFNLEDFLTSVGWGAGFGAGVGGPVGGGIGALFGALGYIGGYLTGTLASTLGADQKTTDVVRRATELLMPLKVGGVGGQIIKEFMSKAPKPVIEGLKYGTFGLSVGYIAEPYIKDDENPKIEANFGQLMGVAGLSALGLYYGRKFAPLGVWGAYSIRNIVSELSEGRLGAGVLVDEGWKPQILKKITGRDIEIPKVKWEDGKLVVKARDVFSEGLMFTRYEVAELLNDLEETARVFEKYGVKIGTEESRELGKILWNPIDDFKTAKLLDDFLENKLGLTGGQKEEFIDALKKLRKSGKVIADRLSVFGGTGEKYLKLLGGSRIFQHVITIPDPELWKQEGFELTRFKDRGKSAIPSFQTTFIRGLVKSHNKQFEQILGRKPKEGDVIRDKDGKTWTYVRLRDDLEPVWFRDWDLEEILEAGKIGKNKTIRFLDITASVYAQVSQDLKLIRQLQFFDWMRQVGEQTGRVSDRPIEGWIQLKQDNADRVIKTWGSLTGKWVSPDLYRHLRAFRELQSYRPPSAKLAWLNRVWKSSFLSLNFKSYIYAFLGNLILTEVNGFNSAEVLQKYFGSLGKNDGIYREAIRHGILSKTFQIESGFADEAREIERLLKLESGRPKYLDRVTKVVDGIDMISRFLITKGYGRVDEMFRYGLYRSLREQGVPEMEASRIALLAYGYYGDMPIIVRNLRDTIMPFISFQVRIFPQLLKAFLNYPERYAVVFALTEALQRYGLMQMYGENWLDGESYEDLVRPVYLDRRPAGILADFVRVPRLEDEEGNVILPAGYMYSGFLPWNIPLSLPQVSNGLGYDRTMASYLSTILIQNPILRFVSGVMMGIDPQSGREILKSVGDNPTASLLQYAFQTLVPSQSLIKYPMNLFAKEGWFDPVVSWFNYFGTYPDGTPVGNAHMIWNAVAPTVIKFDPDFSLEVSLKRLEALERGAVKEFRYLGYRNAPDVILESNFEKLIQFYDDVYKKKSELLDAYLKALGEGGD